MNISISGIQKKSSTNTSKKIHTPNLLRRLAKKLMTVWVLKYLKLDNFACKLIKNYSLSKKQNLMFSIFLLLFSLALSLLGESLVSKILLAASVITISISIYGVIKRNYLFHNAIKAVSANNIKADLREQLRDLGLKEEVLINVLSGGFVNKEVIIAEWDQDNKIYSYLGNISAFNSQSTTLEKFKVRERNKIQLVIVDGLMAVKKKYIKRECMVNEVLALSKLKHLSFIPKLVKVDSSTSTVYMNYLHGINLGNLLASNGLSVSAQYQNSLNKENFESARVFLSKLVSDDMKQDIQQKLKQVHQSGVAIRDFKYGNIIVNGKDVHLCDFDSAFVDELSSFKLFDARSEDIERYNQLFSGDLPGRNDLAEFKLNVSPESYAPIYIGKGVGYGKVGSIEFGTGKWQLIKSYLPDMKDKKVIDLGSNNGNLPLEMLRNGASHVMGFELNPSVYNLAKRNHSLYEFVDNKKYSFDLNNDYMNGVLGKNIADFDIATSFCSLYYENIENMHKIVRYLSKNVSTFIVQANENPEEHTGDMLERSSLDYLQKMLQNNGFKKQTVVRFPLYDRPLIIAYAD